MSSPTVTVVTTTYTPERLEDVRGLLGSLARQTVAPHQIVFVAEGDPAIPEAVRGFGQELALGQLMVVENIGTPGLSGARNAALPHVTGDIVAFIDDDALAFEDWVEQTIAAFGRWPDAIGVTGRALPKWEDPSASWLPIEFYWLISCTDFTGWTTPRAVRNAWGMNMAFRRESFELVCFDEQRGGNQGAADGVKLGPLGEDTQFSLMLRQATGRPIMFDPRIAVYHRVHGYRTTSRYVRRRAFWEGYTKATLPRTGLAVPLRDEFSLLRRVLVGFVPRVATELIRRPRRGWRQLRLAVDALGYVAIGYAAGRLPPIRGWAMRAFGS